MAKFPSEAKALGASAFSAELLCLLTTPGLAGCPLRTSSGKHTRALLLRLCGSKKGPKTIVWSRTFSLPWTGLWVRPVS